MCLSLASAESFLSNWGVGALSPGILSGVANHDNRRAEARKRKARQKKVKVSWRQCRACLVDRDL